VFAVRPFPWRRSPASEPREYHTQEVRVAHLALISNLFSPAIFLAAYLQTTAHRPTDLICATNSQAKHPGGRARVGQSKKRVSIAIRCSGHLGTRTPPMLIETLLAESKWAFFRPLHTPRLIKTRRSPWRVCSPPLHQRFISWIACKVIICSVHCMRSD
jgi:hypothetical protein